MKTQRPGRPSKSGTPGRTTPFSIRLKPELRAQLERDRAARGTTLAQEIEHRLQMAFQFADKFGGPQTYAACQMFAELMTHISKETGKSWVDDAWAADQVARGVSRLLRAWHPGGDLAPPARPLYPGRPVGDAGEDTAEHMLVQLMFAPIGQPDPYAARKEALGTLALRDSARQHPDPDDVDPNQGTQGLRRRRSVQRGNSK